MAAVKRLVRFEPAVGNFRFVVSGKRLDLHFSPERDQVYRLTLQAMDLTDTNGRNISAFGGNSGLFLLYACRSLPALATEQGHS